MTRYIAFLRGINVGGNNMIKMQDLKDCLLKAGFANVHTYIQSGNVLFESDIAQAQLADKIKASIHQTFGMELGVVVFSAAQWKAVIKAAPKDWGKDTTYKHNILIMLEPYDMKQTMYEFGEIKPEIEAAQAGKGVIYQSSSMKYVGRTTYSKIVGKPVYKQVTIRNYNTATKLLKLLESM